MGNAGSSTLPRERHKSSSSDMPSSPVLKDGQAFTFDNRYLTRERQGSSHEEEEPYYTKPVTKPVISAANELPTSVRLPSSESGVSLKDGAVIDPNKKKALPTVVNITFFRFQLTSTLALIFCFLCVQFCLKFKWDGGGKEVYISGTFSDWKTLPMVKSHGDFVTIIDLPEGDHQYKFCVDGEWRHDPKLVSSRFAYSILHQNMNGPSECIVLFRFSRRKILITTLDRKIIWCQYDSPISKYFKRWPKTAKMPSILPRKSTAKIYPSTSHGDRVRRCCRHIFCKSS